mmetsp:Transcript_99089/g.289085  ORF Transcript_99089/g.289085 Transcript_99089/m.289085 type:complete len:212 (+) Transcript_99089:199-834(+)
MDEASGVRRSDEVGHAVAEPAERVRAAEPQRGHGPTAPSGSARPGGGPARLAGRRRRWRSEPYRHCHLLRWKDPRHRLPLSRPGRQAVAEPPAGSPWKHFEADACGPLAAFLGAREGRRHAGSAVLLHRFVVAAEALGVSRAGLGHPGVVLRKSQWQQQGTGDCSGGGYGRQRFQPQRDGRGEPGLGVRQGRGPRRAAAAGACAACCRQGA